MRIVRLISACALFLALFTASPKPAAAQTPNAMTPISALSVNAGSSTITGTLCFTAVDKYGNPIDITKAGGGYYRAGIPFCGTLTAGALTTSLSVPDAGTDSRSGHGYSMQVCDTTTHLCSPAETIFGITGSTAWSLDNYIPASTVSTTQALTFTIGTSAPTGACTGPALYVNGTTFALSVCGLDGAWHVSAGGGGTFNGGTVTNPITAPAFITQGASGAAGYHALTAGTAPAPLSNSVIMAAPTTVPGGGYVEVEPTAPPVGAQVKVCTLNSGSTNVYTCTWTNQAAGGGTQLAALGVGPTSGANAYAAFQVAQTSGNYWDFSFNGLHTDGNRLGCLADISGSNNTLYCDVPTGGSYAFRAGNKHVLDFGGTTVPSGACTTDSVHIAGSVQITLDGHYAVCDPTSLNWVQKF